ncbi:TauD/TfdA family dioxygenase [Nocardia shimofusensis]|uniref:TauD/TfdA family dioxygenase n=1 Tax=Nocardia shimofusensis TaxID=228596 RepID=UPI00082D4618|nr:TauD/TfdA family dioxygenase [Nocardia shimofusensis]
MKSVLPERKTLHPLDIERRELAPAAARAVRALAAEISDTLTRLSEPAECSRTLTDPALIDLVDQRVGELPGDVRAAVRPPEGSAGAAILGTLPVSDATLGATPDNWRDAARQAGGPGHRESLNLDIAVLLLARCVGEPFGWAGQQAGRLVNNILPTPGHELEQSGASSTTLLSPHTEDAFHPDRANLLMLACLRNPDAVGTTVSSVLRVDLDATDRALLGTPTVPILPDVSYGDAHLGYAAPPLPTLWNDAGNGTDTTHPTLRYDPAYTPLDNACPAFRGAYARLGAELERVCVTVVLAPGELLLVDNDVAVHGRVPFTARYDGTDRWLKRVNIRVPDRKRRRAEADENGYGQHTVAPFGRAPFGRAPFGRAPFGRAPFGARTGRAVAERETTPDGRGRREHS